MIPHRCSTLSRLFKIDNNKKCLLWELRVRQFRQVLAFLQTFNFIPKKEKKSGLIH